MKKVQIELSMLVLHTKTVTVQVPEDFDSWDVLRQNALMSSVFEADVEGDGYTEDLDAETHEGTHTYLDNETTDAAPHFIAVSEQDVKRVES